MQIDSYEPGTPCWVDLGSPDPAAAAAFYSGLFGWEPVDQGPEAGGYRMAYLRDRPVAGLGPQQQPGRPYWTTYVSVSDADAMAKGVRAAGGQVHLDPMDVLDAGRMAMFADSTGAPFAVWQPRAHTGAGLVNEPGAMCWNELATRDAPGAKSFYQAALGWTATDQEMGPVTYTEWKLGDRTIAGMMPMDDTWPPEVPAHWMVYFAVDDTDAAAARAEELGGTISVPPTDIPPGRFAVLNDPHGAVFSVIKLA
ncbi:MAG TPA: VOC family protein [Pseudonocardiaceae bacterium]